MRSRFFSFDAKADISIRLAWMALAVFFFILPVGGTTALRNIMLVAMVGLLAWRFWRLRERPDTPLLVPWLAYAIVALFSLIHAFDPHYSLAELQTEILLPFLTFLVGVNIVRDEKALVRFLVILTCSVVFLVAFNLMTSSLGETTKDGLVGSLNSGVGTFSTYLVAIMPFLILMATMKIHDGTTNINLAIGLLVCAVMAALFVTLNRQAFVAVAAELAILPLLVLANFIRLSRHHWLGLLAASSIIFLLFFVTFLKRDPLIAENISTTLTSDLRWETWGLTLARIIDHPWFGSGFGMRTFQLLFPELASSPFWHAHNLILNKGIQMGLPGIVVFLWLMFSVSLRLFKAGKKYHYLVPVAAAAIALAAGMFVKNMTDDFFYRDGSLLFWLLTGICLGYSHGMTNKGRS